MERETTNLIDYTQSGKSLYYMTQFLASSIFMLKNISTVINAGAFIEVETILFLELNNIGKYYGEHTKF